MELVHHELIQFPGGPELFLNQIAIARYTHSLRRRAIGSRVEHVAQEFDGVVGPLRQLGDVEPDRVQALGFAAQLPAVKKPALALE